MARKIPALVVLPQNGSANRDKNRAISGIEKKIKKLSLFFEKQIFLHKFLLWIKVMVVGVETKIDTLLHKVRRRAQEVNKKTKEEK